jgi:hypothetical protein
MASETKTESTFSSSGFSGYIRVRPPEPKRDYECKETSDEQNAGEVERKRKSA